MYCSNCGSQIDDKAVVCPHCGVPTCNYYAQQPVPPKTEQSNKALVTAAKVFIILAFVAYGIALLVLLCTTCAAAAFLGDGSAAEDEVTFVVLLVYFIVVAVLGVLGIIFGARSLKKIKANEKPSTALSVCVLIFTNLIAGVLLLCTKPQDYE